MAMKAKCIFCSKPISEKSDYRKVTGYERKRNSGGTNALRLRTVHQEWACSYCVDKEARGVNAQQGSML